MEQPNPFPGTNAARQTKMPRQGETAMRQRHSGRTMHTQWETVEEKDIKKEREGERKNMRAVFSSSIKGAVISCLRRFGLIAAHAASFVPNVSVYTPASPPCRLRGSGEGWKLRGNHIPSIYSAYSPHMNRTPRQACGGPAM